MADLGSDRDGAVMTTVLGELRSAASGGLFHSGQFTPYHVSFETLRCFRTQRTRRTCAATTGPTSGNLLDRIASASISPSACRRPPPARARCLATRGYRARTADGGRVVSCFSRWRQRFAANSLMRRELRQLRSVANTDRRASSLLTLTAARSACRPAPRSSSARRLAKCLRRLLRGRGQVNRRYNAPPLA